MTQTELKTKLHYDKNTGVFTWLSGSFKGRIAGCKCGDLPDQGYWEIAINKKRYRAHRLAWLYEYGEFPPQLIDHIDKNRTNNSISNLRIADDALNSKNQSIYKNSTTGFHGVTAYGKRWRARININGKKIHLGVFDTIEEAAECRRKKELELGFSVTHGNYKSLTTIPHTIKGSTSQADGDGNSENPTLDFDIVYSI